ncbi:8439_t:CDS:2 [Ambispora gerdemannii]|uniref:8439_t:CDS:1 n=1 Tax=Ambispora gerdemannii TaxID=144530 RepID=A0A9N8ZD93_9GLOM|nr:8439_t:CDS:2 [Ambispora gerdemannii]
MSPCTVRDLKDMKTEYDQFKQELGEIGKFYAEASESGQEVLRAYENLKCIWSS